MWFQASISSLTFQVKDALSTFPQHTPESCWTLFSLPITPSSAGTTGQACAWGALHIPLSPRGSHSCRQGTVWKAVGNSHSRICQPPWISAVLARQNQQEQKHASGRRGRRKQEKQMLKYRLETDLLSKTSPFYSPFSDSSYVNTCFPLSRN